MIKRMEFNYIYLSSSIMKKSVIQSLNTTVSNSPQTTRYIRTSVNSSQTLYRQKTSKAQLNHLSSDWTETPEIDSHDIMILQIEQLRRQNKFLLKKIEELQVGMSKDHIRTKTLLEKEKQQIAKKIDPLPCSVHFFFGQISNLMETMIKLFKGDLNPFDQSKLSQLKEKDKEGNPLKKYAILKNDQLKHNLEGIMLETESKRFQKLVNLFSNYYALKDECQKKLIQKIDKMIIRVNQLNKSLITRVQNTQRKKSTELILPEKLNLQNQMRDFQKLANSTTTSRTHLRNRSSVTPNNCEIEHRFFRRTNKIQQA